MNKTSADATRFGMRKLAARRRRAELAQATADALRLCTGAVQVTVHDGPVTATSAVPDGAHPHDTDEDSGVEDPDPLAEDYPGQHITGPEPFCDACQQHRPCSCDDMAEADSDGLRNYR